MLIIFMMITCTLKPRNNVSSLMELLVLIRASVSSSKPCRERPAMYLLKTTTVTNGKRRRTEAAKEAERINMWPKSTLRMKRRLKQFHRVQMTAQKKKKPQDLPSFVNRKKRRKPWGDNYSNNSSVKRLKSSLKSRGSKKNNAGRRRKKIRNIKIDLRAKPPKNKLVSMPTKQNSNVNMSSNINVQPC